MTVREHIDSITAVESLLNELFKKVFQNDAARRYFGFSQISQLTTEDGLPHWYLWFSEKKGAYSLTIHGGNVASDGIDLPGHQTSNTIVVGAPVLIRYFPDIDEETFESLSCYEQIARMGPSFDSTGTPSFEGGRTLHESYFVAGFMDVIIYQPDAGVDFYCSAPSTWRDYRLDGLALTDQNGDVHEVLSPGDMDRDYPGWDLSFFFFDKIINAYCFVTGRAPRYTGMAEKPSCHHVVDAQNHVNAVNDSTITESIFGVSFFDDTDESAARERYASFSTTLLSHEHSLVGIWETFSDIPEDRRKPEWWSIKDSHFHDDPDHVCSCYEDH